MQKLFLIIFVFLFITKCLVAQSVQNKLPVDKVLKQGQEIEILLNYELDRVVINLQNVLDSESVVYWTMFVGDQEKPENEIGPKKYRTFTLAPKIEDENEPVRLDKKELVLNTGGSDKLFIKVEKGEINIQIKPSEK